MSKYNIGHGRGGDGGAECPRDLDALRADDHDGKVVDTFNPDDLTLYTNTKFFEFDIGDRGGEASGREEMENGRNFVVPAKAGLGDEHLGFLNDGDPFDYMRFSACPTPAESQTTQATQATQAIPPTISSTSTFLESTPTMSPPSDRHHRAIRPSSESVFTPSALPPRPETGNGKRKASVVATSPSSVDGLDDISRLATDEDKRRRNTAASARFRVKKKQREQTLERTAREMTDRVTQLQSKVAQLEMENKWLKNLVVGKETPDSPPAEREVSSKETPSAEGSKDGIGTRKKRSS